MIYDGKEVSFSRPVKTWHQTGLHFPGLGEIQGVRYVVLHWTGGVQKAKGVHEVLRQRALSVQFVVEPDGMIVQFADATARASHAGIADCGVSGNSHSIGIEIVNPATSSWHPAESGLERDIVTERIHGKPLTYTTFTKAQEAAALDLASRLCELSGIPDKPPVDRGRRVIPRVLSREELEAHRGLLGHFHLTARKTDCGLRLLQRAADS